MLPQYEMADTAGPHYYTNTSWALSLVASYTGLNFCEIGQLNYIQFLTWKRDAYINHCEQTPEGREYLRNAWRMTQTKPDRSALRKMTRKEVVGSGE